MMNLSDAQKTLIEEYAITLQNFGNTTAVGRITGYLLIAEPPFVSFDQVVNDLQLSKGSVSNTLKVMELQGQITYFTIPGDRKRYFKLATANMKYLLEKQVKAINSYTGLIEKTLKMRAGKNADYEKEIALLIKNYNKIKEKLNEALTEI
jgi:DNA-binding transcriptional regulator GbsR (MarR family)